MSDKRTTDPSSSSSKKGKRKHQSDDDEDDDQVVSETEDATSDQDDDDDAAEKKSSKKKSKSSSSSKKSKPKENDDDDAPKKKKKKSSSSTDTVTKKKPAAAPSICVTCTGKIVKRGKKGAAATTENNKDEKKEKICECPKPASATKRAPKSKNFFFSHNQLMTMTPNPLNKKKNERLPSGEEPVYEASVELRPQPKCFVDEELTFSQAILASEDPKGNGGNSSDVNFYCTSADKREWPISTIDAFKMFMPYLPKTVAVKWRWVPTRVGRRQMLIRAPAEEPPKPSDPPAIAVSAPVAKPVDVATVPAMTTGHSVADHNTSDKTAPTRAVSVN